MIDSEVHTEAVIRNALCSNYADNPRDFTRELVIETCKLLDKIVNNPLYKGDELREDVLFDKDSVRQYVNKLRERREGNPSPELAKLQGNISKLDYETIYAALSAFRTEAYRPKSVKNTRAIIERLEKNSLNEEDVEKHEEYVANSDTEHLLKGFVKIMGLYFPKGEKGLTHTIKIEGDKEVYVMNPSDGLTIENITDKQFLDKLISSLGGTNLIDSKLAAKLRAIELPEFVHISRSYPNPPYCLQEGSFRVKSETKYASYLVIGVSEPTEIVSKKNNGLYKGIERRLRDDGLMSAVSIQELSEWHKAAPANVMDTLIELLKNKRIKIVTKESGGVFFHGSNNSPDHFLDLFTGE